MQAVGCFSESTDVAADVQRAVSLDQSLEVLLVCAPPAQGSRSAALEAEVALVDSVQSAVQKAQKNALYVYANQPTLRPSKRRSMQAAGGDTLSGFGSYTTCGPLCKVGLMAPLLRVDSARSPVSCLSPLALSVCHTTVVRVSS